MYVCTVHACLVPTEDKEGFGNVEMELQVIVRPCVCAENQTWSSEPSLQPQKKIFFKIPDEEKTQLYHYLFILQCIKGSLNI